MTTQKNQILLAQTDDSQAVIRIVGQGICQISPCFKKVMSTLVEKGVKTITIDLEKCIGVDSTFIGVLAKSANLFHSRYSPEKIEVCGAGDRVSKSLHSLGVDFLFQYTQEPKTSFPPSSSFQEILPPEESDSKKNLTQTSLEAHSTLCDLSDENKKKFEHVLEFLKQDAGNC